MITLSRLKPVLVKPKLIRPDSFGHHAKRVKSFNEVNNDIKDQTTNLYI
ncbi:MAG: hypothetical protein JG763_1733, partial [Shewanella sp.]|nr:hypothetical protein [Shewanella sp.]